jgi:putative oxygen-independent coproporphyrinogen III oxidase
MRASSPAPPLSLYVHIPWCVRKCPYCDFNSHELRQELPARDYIDALLRDLDFTINESDVGGRAIQTIFIGGGTPSLLPDVELERLLEQIADRFELERGCEITLEANPGTIEADRFAGFRRAGVNRLSIGVQSFDDQHLRALGRIHDGASARRAIEQAQAAGFDAVNLDLMFGLPDQTHDQALDDLRQAINFAPAHISWYQLTIEPNTVFYSRPPSLPDDERIWAMQQQGRALLHQCGYRQYEVSAYARPGQRCRHNLNYWRFGDYLGIGAGAHSKITDAENGVIRREARHRLPAAYLQHAGTGAAVVDQRLLTPDDIRLEFMLNALRLRDGVPMTLFNRHTGLAPEMLEPMLQCARERGLLRANPDRLCATAHGARYLNDVVAMFLSDDDQSVAACA